MTISKSEVERIYRDNISKIYKYFFFKTLNITISEDLTSETFLLYIKQLKTSDIDDHSRYIKGIAKNVLNKYLKEKYDNPQQTMPNISIDEWFESKEKDIKPDYVNMLKSLLDKFPLKQKIVMEMRFVQKLSIKEIAVRLGKDENYVSTTQKRGFKTLKDILNVQNR